MLLPLLPLHPLWYTIVKRAETESHHSHYHLLGMTVMWLPSTFLADTYLLGIAPILLVCTPDCPWGGNGPRMPPTCFSLFRYSAIGCGCSWAELMLHFAHLNSCDGSTIEKPCSIPSVMNCAYSWSRCDARLLLQEASVSGEVTVVIWWSPATPCCVDTLLSASRSWVYL